ncbi:hypothetical protein DSM112329_01156 [Paraconexibacter sp. AEG42_29]|uniref:GAF domain-containing protein n=1 Tax=Paraconexibacter sp. AEG42_29 TaxID=2997339 RepID=A0AAU7ART2_9ACTN
MSGVIRQLADLRALEAFFERSEALWAAVLAPEGTVVSASVGLQAFAGRELTGSRFADLVCRPQRAAFLALAGQAADQDWATATLALASGAPDAELVERVVHVRHSEAGLLVVAEPPDRQHEQRVVQLLAMNHALIAVQRQLSDRQQELEDAKDQAERAVRRLETLERITVAAIEDTGSQGGMVALLEQARELVGGQRSTLLLLEPDGRHLTIVHRLGVEGSDFIGWRQPIDAGVSGECARTGRAIVVDDVARDERVTAAPSRPDRSLVVVPLRVAGQVVGVLHVGADRTGSFAPEHVALLAAIGDRAAAVIAHGETVRRERRIAETFQRSMLPSTLPEGALTLVAHYHPQAADGAVGGDWYDAITFPDGCVGLCIGDVAGKGLQAAVTMGQVRSAMHALALNHREPGELLGRLDPFVAGLRTMVTVLYLLVDPAAARMRYASAGHLPALLRHADGTVDALRDALSPPLGFGPHRRAEAVAAFPRGSQLVLYTDGLVERRDEDLLVSLERLATRCGDVAVPHGRLGDVLLEAALDSSGRFDDDVAILTAYHPA